jgi:hypothetical protein
MKDSSLPPFLLDYLEARFKAGDVFSTSSLTAPLENLLYEEAMEAYRLRLRLKDAIASRAQDNEWMETGLKGVKRMYVPSTDDTPRLAGRIYEIENRVQRLIDVLNAQRKVLREAS